MVTGYSHEPTILLKLCRKSLEPGQPALGLAAARAAHAIASVLVQATNAAANPVANRDVDQPGTRLPKSADPSAAARFQQPRDEESWCNMSARKWTRRDAVTQSSMHLATYFLPARLPARACG